MQNHSISRKILSVSRSSMSMTLRDAIRDLNTFASSDILFVASNQAISPDVPAIVVKTQKDGSPT